VRFEFFSLEFFRRWPKNTLVYEYVISDFQIHYQILDAIFLNRDNSMIRVLSFAKN